ncbi:MAG: hypothetical protein L3J52_01545, partial [Proteobacteria bacterium]|nr:hypothetical protein [Pseudomonadota bacterium]
MTKKIKTDIKPSLFKKKTFWAILFLTIYALFGIVYAPTIIKRELISQLNQQLNAETTIEKISFNPFSFATKINKLSLNDLQGNNWITSETIKLDF